MNDNWRPGRDMVRVLVGVIGCIPRPTGHSLVTLFFLSVSVKDCPLLWILVRSQTYYPEHILAYGSGKARCSLVVGSCLQVTGEWWDGLACAWGTSGACVSGDPARHINL